MALFGGKPRTATNAPRHWPPVQLDSWNPENDAFNTLFVSAALVEGLKGARFEYYHDLMYEDGIVRIPFLVEESGQRTAVFTYARTDADACAHYSGVRALLRQREQLNAVYYAPGALTPAKPASVLQTLDTPLFVAPEDERPEAEYALWWPNPEDPTLASSPALAQLDRWFESLDGFGSYLFTSYVHVLKDEPEEKIYALPAQPLMAPLDGPGGLKLMLHGSEEEGLWLAFHVADTPVARRNLMLKLLADSATGFRRMAAEEKVPPRPEDVGRALAFWRGARADALRKEAASGEELRLGLIGSRFRLAGATTRQDRETASHAARPDDELVDFAGEQLDHAMQLVASEGGANPGAPNLHPFVALRAAGHTLRTTLHLHVAAEAVAACPGVVAERRDVEMVVLVTDGSFEENGRSTDALIVRAQKAGDPGCRVFIQRYRPPSSGQPFAALGNWALMGSEPSLMPAAPPAAAEPSEALRRHVEQSLVDRLAWLRLGDGTGAETYSPSEALFSPTLLMKVGDDTFTNVFAMGSLAWAQRSCPKAIAEKPGASLAVLVYDDVTTLDGQPARSLRFRAQERGAPASFVFAQGYEPPRKGVAFSISGPLTLLTAADSIFPGPGVAGPSPAAPTGPSPATPAERPAAAPVAPPLEVKGAADERRRLELTRSSSETLRQERTSVMHRGGPAVVRETDPTAKLRFAAAKCEPEADGIRAWPVEGAPRSLKWSEVAEIRVRQLPSDSPWDRSLLLDFVPVPTAGAPVRIVRSTLINFRGLPGVPATSRNENYRRLALHAASHNPALVFEAASEPFLREGRDCPRLRSVSQIVQDDARFDA